MTTNFAFRPQSGFGNAASATPGAWVAFAILWDGDVASMPGWDQKNFTADLHFPGSDTNVQQQLGRGPLTRSFQVMCASQSDFDDLAELQQTKGTLRVPSAMNDLGVAVEVDVSGRIFADIPSVLLQDLTGVQVWTDGCVSASAFFWRSSRS